MVRCLKYSPCDCGQGRCRGQGQGDPAAAGLRWDWVRAFNIESDRPAHQHTQLDRMRAELQVSTTSSPGAATRTAPNINKHAVWPQSKAYEPGRNRILAEMNL